MSNWTAVTAIASSFAAIASCIAAFATFRIAELTKRTMIQSIDNEKAKRDQDNSRYMTKVCIEILSDSIAMILNGDVTKDSTNIGEIWWSASLQLEDVFKTEVEIKESVDRLVLHAKIKEVSRALKSFITTQDILYFYGVDSGTASRSQRSDQNKIHLDSFRNVLKLLAKAHTCHGMVEPGVKYFNDDGCYVFSTITEDFKAMGIYMEYQLEEKTLQDKK